MTSPRTILVVDDDAAIRQALAKVLTREGHTVLLAGDLAAALELAILLKRVLRALDVVQHAPAYNWFLHSTPLRGGDPTSTSASAPGPYQTTSYPANASVRSTMAYGAGLPSRTSSASLAEEAR